MGSITPPEGITVRYWRNEPSLGPVGNQQKLFASVRGRRFVYMNDDDVLLPGAASAMAAAFGLTPDVILAYGLEQIIDQAGEVQPALSDAANIAAGRVPQSAGLRRDLLVAALNVEISHVGFMCCCPRYSGQGHVVRLARMNSAGDRYRSALCGWTWL